MLCHEGLNVGLGRFQLGHIKLDTVTHLLRCKPLQVWPSKVRPHIAGHRSTGRVRGVQEDQLYKVLQLLLHFGTFQLLLEDGPTGPKTVKS